MCVLDDEGSFPLTQGSTSWNRSRLSGLTIRTWNSTASCWDESTPDGERGYQLAVYAKSGGGYVASVKYLTTFPSERPVAIADCLDRANDVENFFLVVEPREFLRRDLLRQLPDDQRQRLKKSLRRIYDGHLDTILNITQEYASRHPDADGDVSDKTPRRNNGLLGHFGLD